MTRSTIVLACVSSLILEASVSQNKAGDSGRSCQFLIVFDVVIFFQYGWVHLGEMVADDVRRITDARKWGRY